ncbi:IS21 family transposase [Micromonospora sp. LOL_013]|uniref:IS21 family transposase n=1 Tax=Micromonospora sp. LOL_013 TaxID=3345414 RepID=UPI003A83ABC3
MIKVEDWAEIRRLYLAEQMPIKAIARKLGLSRNTVRSAVRSAQPPKYTRAAKGSIVDAAEPRIRALLKEFPDMPATVIAERIGWTRSLTVLKERVRELRPVYAPVDPVSRTVYGPGERAQCDLWFPPVPVPLGFGQVASPPVLVMVSGYSRWLCAVTIPTRSEQDLALGQWAVLRQLGRVPRELVWDNESGVGRYGGTQPRLTAQFSVLRGMAGTRVRILRPRDPESKGLVERANGYLETSFLPGRRFTSVTDFNIQLTDWIASANTRPKRALDAAAPADRIGADLAAMGALPPVEVTALGWRHAVRLGRDHYVRLDSCDYSVHPSAVGHRVEVAADLHTVRVLRSGVLVGEHERCWARQQTITDPEHAKASAVMRQAYQDRPRGRVADQVACRDLADYDRILGTGTGTGTGADDLAEVA